MQIVLVLDERVMRMKVVGGQGGRAAVALSYQKTILEVVGGHGANREGNIN